MRFWRGSVGRPNVRWHVWICLAIAVSITGVVHSRMRTPARIDEGGIFIPAPQKARLSSLGFDAAVADYYWIQTLQLIGGSGGNTRQHSKEIGELIDVVTTVDPWIGPAYRLAAVWLTGSEEDVRTAIRLLERGVAYLPLDWRNRYHLGFNHFFYLEENAKAADVLEKAIPLEGVPNYLGPLVARLRTDRGGIEMAAGFLSDLARNAPDEYSRAEYLKALDEIETERRARYLDAAREEYWRRHGEDIRGVGDLVRGPNPILPVLPGAHPHFDDYDWVLDEESGQIVSSFYGSRYALHTTPRDDERRARWRKQRLERARES